MRGSSRSLLAAAVAVVALALGVAQAQAATATFSPGGSIAASATTPFTANTSFGRIECRSVTWRGTITAGTYATSSLADVGRVTVGASSSCSLGGTAIPAVQFNTTPNWTIALMGGSIVSSGLASGMQILGFSFTETATGCTFNGSLSLTLTSTGVWIVVGSGAGPCGSATVSGAFSYSPLQSIS